MEQTMDIEFRKLTEPINEIAEYMENYIQQGTERSE
jgi:hypothetical protein